MLPARESVWLTTRRYTCLECFSPTAERCWRLSAESAPIARRIRSRPVRSDRERERRDEWTTESDRAIANFIRFPFNGFTYFLTLFSKSFSPFPHGSCSLSVSCPYLPLDEVYHPFWAAFPNNPTLRKYFASAQPRPRTGLSLSTTCCSKQLGHGRSRRDNTSWDYNSPFQHNGDLQVELIPLHSPLLRESWLVSFPPLSNMLKFSG